MRVRKEYAIGMDRKEMKEEKEELKAEKVKMGREM